jgi:hypothetical protein
MHTKYRPVRRASLVVANWSGRLRLALGVGLGLLFAVGCSQRAETTSAASASKALKSPADALTDAEIQQFLKIVAQLPGQRVPEFSPEDEDEFNTLLSARELVENYRGQFQRLFDPVRQGKIWIRNHQVAAAVGTAHLTTTQFAALVRSLSCALMRAQLEQQQDLQKLIADCRSEVERLIQRIEQTDALPQAELTQELGYERTQSALRLGRMVALLEFTELLTSVPDKNVALIQKYQRELAPLVPASSANPLANPFATRREKPGAIQQTGYSQ